MEVFIHIPKTGGTTIVQTLSNQIYFGKFQRLNPTWNTHPKDFLESVPGLLEEVLVDKPQIKVVGGHFGFGAHPELREASQHFTVLRDPVERVISEYYYMKYKGMYYQELIEKEELTLSQYLTHPEINYLNNLQTRLISGVSYEHGDNVTESMFDLAAENMKRFKTIGLTEQMDNTLALFYLMLGWERVPYYTRSNANDQRPEEDIVSGEVLEIINQRDHYDMKLYALGRQLFEEMVLSNMEEIDRVKTRIMNPFPGYKFYLRLLNKFNKRIF